MLCGLYLSKYDLRGLKELGFEGFTEAYNVLGLSLGAKRASIKNYRDEFDPLFPNPRRGWHKRLIRESRLRIFEEYDPLDFASFTRLVKSFVGLDLIVPDGEPGNSSFARRLITGLAAEQYFESVHHSLPEFESYIAENTTRLGCGYDFRLSNVANEKEFVVVEVKGLREPSGTLSLTAKEHNAAVVLSQNFYLFVVKNFRKKPSHEIFRNPLSGSLNFKRTERRVIQVSWTATV